ncbi:MAG: GNAT family N-acetyltransferase [Clostridiaceae bacterium]|nr:GNAT family N-acetyltransferase [Clostridiaceae bacterium]
MIYRPAGCSDIPCLIRLRLAFLAELHGPLTEEQSASFSATLEDYFRRCLGKTLLCYLAEEDGESVSTVFLTISEKPASESTPTGYFGTALNVYTCPEYRRQGHAAALMRMAIEDGHNRNLSYIELMATAMGESVYRALGFSERTQGNKPMIFRF